MNSQFRFFTDTATLAFFDPERLSRRADSDGDWWCSGFMQLPEVQAGSIGLVELGGDGIYRLRITDGDLTRDERDYAVSSVRGLGVEVIGGRLFVGPAECIPGEGAGFTPADVARGLLLEMGSGQYDIDVFAIGWFDSPRWWREDQSVPDDAPAEIVAVLRPRLTPFAGLDSEPRLDVFAGSFLFPSATRRVGPEQGMILTTKVRKGPSNELCLKDCGPRLYRASLVDYTDVFWKDTIQLRVVSVDHEARRLTGEFVGKLAGQ